LNEVEVLADELVSLIRNIYGDEHVPLHRPLFEGNERQYLIDCIDSNFVSSVGERVDEFERRIAQYVGARHAIATANGTAALHIALLLAGVSAGDEVITQAMTFIATCNATKYCDAHPVFVDIDQDTLGLSPRALKEFLSKNAEQRPGGTFNRTSGRRISACVPMHTFGLPCRISEIVSVCNDYGIPVIEDAAESLGSFVGDRHTGTFGKFGTFSFNGNKIITTGGGGMIVTDDEELASRAKHLTTTAKIPHPWDFVHDEVGYNYRMPNLNAALGCAQIERLPEMLAVKAKVAERYSRFFAGRETKLVKALPGTKTNNWLNAIILDDAEKRDAFLSYTNNHGVMTRPVWKLMHHLDMFRECQNDGLANSLWLEDRILNLPSSVPDGAFEKGNI